VPVDDDVVPHLHVVPEGQAHVCERLEVLPASAEYMTREDAPEVDSQFGVLAQRATVEHLPKPDQGLSRRVTFQVDFFVVLRLQSDIARI
jgi:hypothetical protein